ncbi:MAG: Phytochrome-like protein cph1 [Verrucomicrobiota bacterium]|jgi:PAS domain S-box-containing protein
MGQLETSADLLLRAGASAEEYLAAVLAAVEQAIIGVNRQGRIISWSRGAEIMFGHTAAEVEGHSAAMLVPAEMARAEEKILAGVLSGNGVARNETVRLRANGERITVALSVSPLHDQAGAIIGALQVARDITEQNKIFAVISQLRMAMDAAPNGMVMIDAAGKMVMVNAHMERLFGYVRAEMIGESIELLIPPRYRPSHPALRDAYFASPEARAMGHGRDLYARRKDGSEFPVEVGLNPAHTAEGTYVLGAIIDISARKKMEAELAKVHSDLQERATNLEAVVADRASHLEDTIAELEGVSYSLSHDLRGPLRTIQGFAQLVLEDAGDRLKADEKELLGKAIRAAHRLDRLIQDVLTYTRVSRQLVSIETLDVEKLLGQIIDERPAWQSPLAEIQIASPLHPVQGHEASLT